jgi:hypothetical protein
MSMTVVVDIDDLDAEVQPVLDWLKTQGGQINFIEGIRKFAGDARLVNNLLTECIRGVQRERLWKKKP